MSLPRFPRSTLIFSALLVVASASRTFAFTVSGTTYTTNGSQDDVAAAIAAAPKGAMVTLPAGAFTWGTNGSSLAITNAIILTGAQGGQTVINLAATAPSGSSGTIQLYAGATIENLTMNGSASATPFAVGNANGWRLTAITYNANGDPSYFCYIGGGYGVIDSSTITSTNGNNELIFIRGAADAWQTPDSLGTANAVYVEDCIFNGPGYVCDANANARVVIRFNKITGVMKVDAHGYASNTPRGARHFEVYDNRWTYGAPGSSDPTMYFAQIELRGGTGMIFDNRSDMSGNHGAGWYILTDYGYENSWPNFGNVYQTPRNYPLQDQIGVGSDVNGAKASGGSAPLYSWNNNQDGSPWPRLLKQVDPVAIALYQQQTGNNQATFTEADIIKPDRDVFMDLSVGNTFDGTTGVGRGTRVQMGAVAARTTGVGFWVTDESGWNTRISGTSGQLYVWNGSAWNLKYTPYTYPHPLRSLSDAAPAPAPAVTPAPAPPAPSAPAVSPSMSPPAGAAVTLTATATGTSYQWQFNGVAIQGATSRTLTFAQMATYQAGSYAVIVTNQGVPTTSPAVTLTVTEDARLTALSGYAYVTSSMPLDAGFTTAGGSKNVLLRADGPSLGWAAATTLALLDSTRAVLARDTGWSNAPIIVNAGPATVTGATSAEFASVGALPFHVNSADSALWAAVGPGTFMADVLTVGAGGAALAEIYDADSAAAPAVLSRVSIRGIASDQYPLTASFVIQGTTSQTVLLRGIGPSLLKVGVYGTLQHPKIILSQSGANGGPSTVIATCGAWGSAPVSGPSILAASLQPATSALISRAGASAFPTGSADAAFVATLPPGVYTIQALPNTSTVGMVQAEICNLP